jgi:hypothetical protein
MMKTDASSKKPTATPTTTSDPGHPEDDFVDDDDLEGFSDLDESAYNDEYKEPEVDDKDVIVLKEGNFSEFVEQNQFVMVEFYASWVSDYVFLRRRGS